MVMNSAPLSGLIGIVLVVVLIGIIAGLAISGSDLLNYNTNAAAARAQDQKTQEQSQRAAVDLQYYKAIQAARTESEKEILRLELEARQHELEQNLALQRERAEQDLELARLTRYVVLAVGPLATLIVCIGLTAFLIQYGRSLLVLAQNEAARAALWHAPAWRAEQIRLAREREGAERETALAQQTARRPATGGNGRHPPKSEPVKGTEWQASPGAFPCLTV